MIDSDLCRFGLLLVLVGGCETADHPDTTDDGEIAAEDDGGTPPDGEETADDDDDVPRQTPDAEHVPPEDPSCESHGATQACDAEQGSGTRFCDDLGAGLAWGPCLSAPACRPGELEACGCANPDQEECGPGQLAYDVCILHEGVPAWESEVDEESDCNTPLVLSFDGAPVQMSPAPAAAFDIDGVGACLSTDWPAVTTPWLAIDLDGSGTIESGRELFGSGMRLASGRRAKNGFIALAQLDSNSDGRISAADDRFADLVLWSDIDADKRGTLAEMQPLAARGILSIEVDYAIDRRCDARGNCEVERARFEFIDRTSTVQRGQVVDLHLACQ